MPFTTPVDGTAITVAYATANIRNQVVTPFASESARNSAIATEAVDGMVSTITGDSHGPAITSYNSSAPGGAAWQLAAEAPRHVALRTAGDVMSGVTGVKNAYTTSSITIKGSTVYRIKLNALLKSGAAANAEFLCNIVRVSTGVAVWTGPRLQQRATGEGVAYVVDIPWISGAGDTSVAFIVQTNCVGGTAYDLCGSATIPFYFEVRECNHLSAAVVTPPVVT